MDNQEHEKDNDRKKSNTEYLPTKCRITKPPPPKPAANPLQFVKVAPCPLYQKAQEQIKKVEEIKRERKEITEETEDWQLNLDNWKSSRRKRQEHIIERVVEVKKLEHEEQEKNRRKGKTFNEMMGDRRHKVTIPLYEDDTNDLSDYGIGSSSSKTNSIKDVDTDDNVSILDEKEQNSFDSPSVRDNSNTLNQSENETNILTKIDDSKNNNSNIYTSTLNCKSNSAEVNNSSNPSSAEQYTYEGAIQDYRSRIQLKMNVDESIFTRNKDLSKSNEAQTILPRGEIFKRKELFEGDKTVEINTYESNTSRRLSEDFTNTRSIKDRLKSLEQSFDQASKNSDKDDIQVSVKQRLQNFMKLNDADNQNNNANKARPKRNSTYLLEKSSSTPTFDINTKDWSSINVPQEHKDFDNVNNKNNDSGTEEYQLNYIPSTSSIELAGLSSDREDSGIQTADVSCSVSQADDPVDTDLETAANTIPNCIEKLNQETKNIQLMKEFHEEPVEKNMEVFQEDYPLKEPVEQDITKCNEDYNDITKITENFLQYLKIDASNNLSSEVQHENTQEQEKILPVDDSDTKSLTYNNQQQNQYENVDIVNNSVDYQSVPKSADYENVVISNNHPQYENVELKNYVRINSLEEPIQTVDILTSDFLNNSPFIMSAALREPPKVKPPPPPPPEEDEKPMKRMNSTKRLKKEIHLKRSSFLGLDEPTDDQIDPDIGLEKPPDISTYLQRESKLEKSLYKKMQEDRIGNLSKVESQDSGLDIDRGRLSSDTWCSSIGDSSTPSHERQDSEQTNSITSEEDEITKKEREIIELVEKEEQSRDPATECVNTNSKSNSFSSAKNETSSFEPSLGSEQFKNPYFPQPSSDFDDQDSEVLKVEQELRQLEQEELERQRENLLFKESRTKARLQNNRHSLENICDDSYLPIEYRKSNPELQHLPLEYRKSVPDVPTVYRNIPDMDIQYRQSMPNIQHMYQASAPELTLVNNDILNNRKSLPNLKSDIHRSAFQSPPIKPLPPLTGKPLKNPIEPKHLFNPIVPGDHKKQPLSKHNLHSLSAAPRPRHNDNWIQPKPKTEKNYNQHWLIQEAEQRRISDQQKNAFSNRNWQQQRHEKHLPDSIIQSLTQRVQNRTNINERNSQIRRPDQSPNRNDFIQHPYLTNPQTVGHAMPLSYPPLAMEETQDRMLSVSGKKKCSYCGRELGRGAAMIIESLCLFYHMECFKCCVCHMQLGDGRMGTDVRVRNQKLHCQNCYSSDDGVKFSCV